MDSNKQWLEGVHESFETLISQGNYVEAKELIQKVRDEGFEIEANQLQAELVEETLGTFLFEIDPKNLK